MSALAETWDIDDALDRGVNVLSVMNINGRELETLTPRERVFALENSIKELPNAILPFPGRKEILGFPLKHHIARGMYVREIFMPAGHVVVGEIHKHEHLAIVCSGDISVYDENGLNRITGPYPVVFCSTPGIKRAIYMHTDCIFMTVHSITSDENDIVAIEEEIACKTYAEFDRYIEQQRNTE